MLQAHPQTCQVIILARESAPAKRGTGHAVPLPGVIYRPSKMLVWQIHIGLRPFIRKCTDGHMYTFYRKAYIVKAF